MSTMRHSSETFTSDDRQENPDDSVSDGDAFVVLEVPDSHSTAASIGAVLDDVDDVACAFAAGQLLKCCDGDECFEDEAGLAGRGDCCWRMLEMMARRLRTDVTP